MQLLVIAVVYTLLLAAGECQRESKSPSTSVNSSCPCGDTYIYTMNVGDGQSSVNANDKVKEAVKAVVEQLLEEKMEAVIDHLEEKIENATKNIDVKEQIKDLTFLANQNQRELIDLLNASQLVRVSSCKNLPPNSLSGYYWTYNSTGDLTYIFCDMTRKCGCNGTGGWMRVANLNMADLNQECPDGLRLITSPKRTCGRVTPTEGCTSVVYPTNGYEYTQVCGKIKAYQYGQPEAFSAGNRWLIDGIGLYTRGQSQHIWSFVVGLDEVSTNSANVCPCNSGFSGVTIPAAIGQDYFCDTGSETRAQNQVFHSNDPLWDGTGCGSRSTCCSFNNPPWFCKQLPQPTTNDIELQMCGYNPITNEDTPIEIVEIYIQ